MFIAIWVLLSILTGVYAKNKGYSQIGWIFTALLISPLIAFILLLIGGNNGKTCNSCQTSNHKKATKCKACRDAI
jgi:hypothetical protein